MVRINLLGEKIGPKTQGVIQQVILGAVLIVALNGLMFFRNYGVDSEIGRVEDETRKIEASIAELKTIIGDLDKIKAKRDELTKKIGIIDQLNELRTGPMRAMQDLSFAIPYNEEVEKLPKKMWLSDFKQDADGRFTMKGMSLDNETIATFINNLGGYDTYCDVRFDKSAGKTLGQGNSRLFEFDVSGRFCLGEKKAAGAAPAAAGGK